MANIIFGPGSSYSGGAALDVPGSPPLQASAGTVTTVIGTINQPIASVNTFSLVQYGISPYTYSISSGTLPTGVALNSSTGVVSGIPTVIQASSSVTFSVTDSLGVTSGTTSTVAFTVVGSITATANTVAPISIITNQSIPSFNPFTSVTNGSTPYWYFVSSGQLPDRVTLDPTTGLVSGTPTEPYSTANVTFSVRDAGGIVAATTSTVSFTVIQSISAVAGATTTVSANQNTAITSFNPFSSVTGGYTPYVYSVSSGTLPTGININSSTGLVSGTPTAIYATANVTFRVTDAQSNQASTTATVSFTVLSAGYTVQYLVVAGGGGGASGDKSGYGMGGGGGAGGMLASSFTANPGTSYTINVGGGGAGATPTTSPPGVNSGSAGIPGFSSNIFQGATPVVTTTGGGGGGFSTTDGPGAGGPGGSGGSAGGGGGGIRPPGAVGGAGGVATGSPGPGVTGPQGFPGGSGSASPQPTPSNASGGGGGGGKGGAGTTAVTPTSQSGPGGAGAIWPFTGPTLYAGGGGGAGTTNAPQSAAGTGGSGIGGNGGAGPAGGAGFSGTNGTGSGGGGGAGTNTGGNGGYGVIKLAIPNAVYPTVSAPGASVSTPPAAPGLTVLTYIVPGSPLAPQQFTFIA
jgi:hypothetical protein